MSSDITHSDTGLDAPRAKKKRSRKNQGKTPNSLTSNDVHPDHPKCTSLINNSPLENYSFQHPLVSTCLTADSELVQHGAELRFSEDIDKGMHQNSSHNALESRDSNHDFPVGGGRDCPTTIDTKYTGEVNVNSISEFAEHDDQVGANNVSQEIKATTTYQKRKKVRRRQKKVSDSLVKSLESKDGAGCLRNTLEREAEAGHVTSQKVVEDILVEMPSGVYSDLKHASGDSKNGVEMDNLKDIRDGIVMDLSVSDSSGEDFEQAKRAKLNVNQNVLCDVHSADELPEESAGFCKVGIAAADASGQDPVSEPLDQKRQSKIKDASPSSAELDEMKDNISHIVNTNNSPQHMLHSSVGRALLGCFRRKLLVLDVNGLLADVVPYVPAGYKADKIIGMKAVFKRPFCDDFLQFCFERFNVGVWSSRTEKNLQMVIDFLMGKSRSNLLFCWDQSHCTKTGFNTLENRDKPLVLKELAKLWEKHEPSLPWERGEYNESNTLLFDDSPYKALRNPPNTGLFPHTYQYKDKKDNSLGPGGDLRVYLEGLALAENVQKYVEQNPYGQLPITKSHPSWHFYAKVMGTTSFKKEDCANHSDLEHASRENNNRIAIEESKGTIDEDSFTKEMPLADLTRGIVEQSKWAKLNVHQNAECDVYSAEQRFEECRKVWKEEKSSDDTCGQHPPTEPLEEKGQSKMVDPIPSLSEVDALKGNADQVRNEEIHPPQMPQSSLGRDLVVCFKRKLLVLDVNGLLADVVSYVPDGYKADTKIGEKGVFKRPFCDDFLHFCFERFRVGLWSTTTKRNVRLNLNFLMGRRTMQNLLFCWDRSHCIETGFCTVESRDRTIILKELRIIWEKHESYLPWKRGEYDESNTLLLDTCPSTALLNPPHTAIFPPRYRYKDESDNSLGPGGDLRVYLEGLASAENVQNYVQHNPFGQRPITEKNLSWNYYLKVIGSTLSQLEDDANNFQHVIPTGR